MKKIEISNYGMTSLSPNEAAKIDGGSFFSDLVHITALTVQFLFVEPLKAAGDGFTKGISSTL